MKKLLKYVMFFILPTQAMAQETFVKEGRIEFERKINLHRQMDGENEDVDWFKDMIAKLPTFHTSTFSLYFKGGETIYKPLGEIEMTLQMPWILGPAKENIIQTDLDKYVRTGSKTVFEQRYLVTDSIGQIKWRITDEKRNIAGLECRKAVAIICDSVYVVAFYADEIPVSGGPESFDGLPGMILGLVIPRLHTTWFATKIVLGPPEPKDFVMAARGQRIQKSKLTSTLQSSLKDWGKYGQRNIWWVML